MGVKRLVIPCYYDELVGICLNNFFLLFVCFVFLFISHIDNMIKSYFNGFKFIHIANEGIIEIQACHFVCLLTEKVMTMSWSSNININVVCPGFPLRLCKKPSIDSLINNNIICAFFYVLILTCFRYCFLS